LSFIVEKHDILSCVSVFVKNLMKMREKFPNLMHFNFARNVYF